MQQKVGAEAALGRVTRMTPRRQIAAGQPVLTRWGEIRTLRPVMWRQIAAIVVVLSGILATALCFGGEDVAAPASSDQQILLLRNGEILAGRITKKERLYSVDLSNGQIRVKADEVELVCGSLEEGYRRKRALIQVGNVHHHLELAQWCLRHGLVGPAAVELADATTADPNHRMIAVLHRRLKTALEPPPAVVASKPMSTPSKDELDRMVRNLPKEVVETFTQSVQPVLINHCATSECHGPQAASDLRLFRATAGRSVSRRITQRNLHAVLSFVDCQNPAASQLLIVPTGPHGTVEHAIFSRHQAAQFQRLVNWTNQLAGQSSPELPPTRNLVAPWAPDGPASIQIPPAILLQEARNARPLPVANPAGEAIPASFDQPAAAISDPGDFSHHDAAESPRMEETAGTKDQPAVYR